MITIYEVKPNTYKVPAIDNRNRKGYAMFQVVASKLGTPSIAEMVKMNGEIVKVKFSATGWMVL